VAAIATFYMRACRGLIPLSHTLQLRVHLDKQGVSYSVATADVTLLPSLLLPESPDLDMASANGTILSLFLPPMTPRPTGRVRAPANATPVSSFLSPGAPSQGYVWSAAAHR
jgi:hypothetical protein